MKMKQKQLTSYDLISGMTARNYRKKLAASSVRPDDSMLTLKFRLDLPADLQERIPFESFRHLYGVVEGVGKGSLIHYLFSAILSGFRIFGIAGDAQTFFTRNAFQDAEFQEAFLSATGLDLPDFIPSLIKKRLIQGVRARGGKDNQFKKEIIVREYRKSLASKLPVGTDEEKVDTLFSKIADHLLKDDRLQGWMDLKNKPVIAAEAVDRALSDFCGNSGVPMLAPMLKEGESELPKNSTIVFDDASIHIDSDNVLAPYFTVATILRHFRGADRSNNALRKYVQENLTTNTNSGLSWFFGAGLNLLRTKSLDELCESYAIPPSRKASMHQLQEAAKAIPGQTLLYKNTGNILSYSDFRTVVGGHLDSWVANYINRLYELKSILQEMPEHLSVPSAFIRGKEDFLDTTNCSRTDIELLCNQFNGDYIQRTLKALDNLLGMTDTVSADDILQIEQCTGQINQLTSFREQMKNALKQASNNRNSSWWNLQAETADSWKDWDKIVSLPKLNRMTGGVPDAEEELATESRQFAYLLNAQKSHFERIKKWTEQQGQPLNPLGVLEEAQKKALEQRPSAIAKNGTAEEMAIRLILHRIGNTVRVCNDAFAGKIIQWFISNRIFSNDRDRNRFFFNRQGSLYVSPFSTRNHQAYPVRKDIAAVAVDLLKSLGRVLEDVTLLKELDADAQDTFLKLNRLWLAFQLSGLNKPIPGGIAELDLPAGLEQSIPADLQMQVKDGNEVSASSVRKLFNLYASLLSGMQTVLRRSRFYLRSKFSWVDNNALYYVPKDRSWSLPERYQKSEAWQEIFNSKVLVLNEDGTVNTLKTFEAVIALPIEKQALMKPLLIQLPHDWCYSLPFAKGKDSGQEVFLVKKNGSKGTELSKRKVTGEFVRLIGPSSMKSQLDELIIAPKQITVSDMTLLIDQPVNQRKDDDGEIILDYESYEMTLAVPIARKKLETKENKTQPFKRIVAIDQGEAGLAYAVFNLDDVSMPMAEPLASGTIRIPSIRRLIKGVRKFRKSAQKTQKFNQRFDSSMFTLRENATGDVCGVIVGLMHRFRAFPVLEFQVKNLESGSRQLEMVYKSVNARFLYSSDVPMQNSEREAWWYKGNYWTIPGIYRPLSSTEKGSSVKNAVKVDGKTFRPLNVFPGASVNASMTSRICSCCGNNIWQLIRDAEEQGIKSFNVHDGGEITVNGKTIKLYDKPDNSLRRFFARRNERVPLNTPINAGQISLQELRSRVMRNLRRPPKSLQSRDTTQSRYFCVFKDCKAHNQERHADINAAINIGRRFLNGVVRISST